MSSKGAAILGTEVERMERLVKEAKNLLDVLKTKEEVQIRLKMIKAESEEIQSRLEDNEGMMGKLRWLSRVCRQAADSGWQMSRLQLSCYKD